MIDRLFLATLTFCVLIAGTLAIGSAMLGLDQHSAARRAAAAPVRIVQLERVVVTAKRMAPNAKLAQGDNAARVQ
jgi:hypothetical protein